MDGIFVNGINSYLDNLLPERDDILLEMEEYATETSFPIVGPQVGYFLYQIAALKKPKMIFELGSGFGYSAYWFALGSSETNIICTERSDENIERGQKWMKQAGFDTRVKFHQGDAREILKTISGEYDLIMNDIDKHEYPDAFHLAMTHLSKNGVLITDNVLWHGKVADGTVDDAGTNGIREYNRLIYQTSGIMSSILPIRDGIAVSYKLE